MAGSKERERRRARERFERQREQRLARKRRNMRRTGIGLAVLCVLGLSVGLTVIFTSGGTPSTASAAAKTAAATPTTSAAAVAEPAHHCTYTAASTSSGSAPGLPAATPDYKAHFTATINTNRGKIGIDLLNAEATCTVNSFVHLAAANFYDSTQCHRISDSGGLYMLQCGDPTARASATLSCSSTTVGTGGPGYTFADENLTGATYKAGTVAMANSGPNTNGSQFFLVFKNTTLSANYTPFGTITSGLDILQNIAKAGTSCTYPQAGGGVPKEKVVIESVTIKKS